jgi:hypothetical protein
MLFLGIDQHARQLTVSLRDQKGDVILARQVSTQPEKILDFCDQLTRHCAQRQEPFIAVLEGVFFCAWFRPVPSSLHRSPPYSHNAWYRNWGQVKRAGRPERSSPSAAGKSRRGSGQRSEDIDHSLPPGAIEDADDHACGRLNFDASAALHGRCNVRWQNDRRRLRYQSLARKNEAGAILSRLQNRLIDRPLVFCRSRHAAAASGIVAHRS